MSSSSIESELSPLALFGGLNALEVWPILYPTIYPAWGLMMLVPRWKYTRTISTALILFHALLYVLALGSLQLGNNDARMDFDTLEGVATMFKNPNVAFVGWIHYLCFDPLVGSMIVSDSQARGVSITFHYLVLVPILLATLMFGPVGFLAYSIVKLIVLPQPKKEVY